MNLAAIVTMIGGTLIALALALYLTLIVRILARVNFALGTVLIGVRAIERQAGPLDPTLAEISEDITAIVNALREADPGPAATPQYLR